MSWTPTPPNHQAPGNPCELIPPSLSTGTGTRPHLLHQPPQTPGPDPPLCPATNHGGSAPSPLIPQSCGTLWKQRPDWGQPSAERLQGGCPAPGGGPLGIKSCPHPLSTRTLIITRDPHSLPKPPIHCLPPCSDLPKALGPLEPCTSHSAPGPATHLPSPIYGNPPNRSSTRTRSQHLPHTQARITRTTGHQGSPQQAH